MKRIPCVMLVDDDEADNFFHRRALQKSGRVDNVVVVDDPRQALAELAAGAIKPNLMFLDINMPGMNGWEFLQCYEALPEEQRQAMVVVMLSTADLTAHRDKVEASPTVHTFRSKPLTSEMFVELLEELEDVLPLPSS
ncbi:MAG: response regulator [Planctomycetota bacterium]